MKNQIILLIIGICLLSCVDNKEVENMTNEIQSLRIENDSLKSIVNAINEKYVFDNVAVRTIPNYENTDKLNSIYKQEIVFIGYNDNGNSRVMFNAPEEKGISRSDTLRMEKGAFILERKLTEKKNFFNGTAETYNEYGKIFGTQVGTAIWAQ